MKYKNGEDLKRLLAKHMGIVDVAQLPNDCPVPLLAMACSRHELKDCFQVDMSGANAAYNPLNTERPIEFTVIEAVYLLAANLGINASDLKKVAKPERPAQPTA